MGTIASFFHVFTDAFQDLPVIDANFPLRDDVDAMDDSTFDAGPFFLLDIDGQIPKQDHLQNLQNPIVQIVVGLGVSKPVFDNDKNWVSDNVEVEVILIEGCFPFVDISLLIF